MSEQQETFLIYLQNLYEKHRCGADIGRAKDGEMSANGSRHEDNFVEDDSSFRIRPSDGAATLPDPPTSVMGAPTADEKVSFKSLFKPNTQTYLLGEIFENNRGKWISKRDIEKQLSLRWSFRHLHDIQILKILMS